MLFGVTIIISYYLAANIYNNKYNVEEHSKIAILSGIKLKEKAKCFKLHDILSEELSKVLQKMNKSEMDIRTKYDNIRKNNQISSKQKQQKITHLENNWKQISENYNNEIQKIKNIDEKLTTRIYEKLNKILKEIAQKMNISAILNEGNSDTTFVFYSEDKIDITDVVVKTLDDELKDLDIKEFSE